MDDRSGVEETASYGYGADISQALKVIVMLINFINCSSPDRFFMWSLV